MLVGMVVDTSGLIPKSDSLVFDSLGRRLKSLFDRPVFTAKDITKKITMGFPKDVPPRKDLELVMELIPELETNYAVDKQRLYVGGLSLGGRGTYELVRRMPDTFAAAVVICQSAEPATANSMHGAPGWRL